MSSDLSLSVLGAQACVGDALKLTCRIPFGLFHFPTFALLPSLPFAYGGPYIWSYGLWPTCLLGMYTCNLLETVSLQVSLQIGIARTI